MKVLVEAIHRLTQRVEGRLGQNMKNIRLVAVLGVLAAAGLTPVAVCAAEADGVAVAIVYDTSGSMKDQVRDGAGKLTPKYVIANRALENIATRLQTFATNKASGTSRDIQAGLFVFDGNRAKQVVKFGSFDANAFKDWAQNFSSPNGGTPLGNALAEASKTVLNSGLPHKHVLIITDGVNTQGPTPAAVMARVRHQAEAKQTAVSIHFVAFDVDANVFSGVKKLGATVVGAADEIQLNKQLQFILERKILLEDEEPPKKQ
jgi:uncharacterized protein YegL